MFLLFVLLAGGFLQFCAIVVADGDVLSDTGSDLDLGGVKGSSKSIVH